MPVSTESTWFRRYRVARPRARLLCLPHAGGSASFFHSWGHALGADIEVLAARYPGRQERIAEPCVESMESLAESITRELLPYTDVPLAVFGHSMGASLAYEVGVRLEKRYGTALRGLFVSCRQAPHRVEPERHDLRGDEAVVAEVRRLGGTDPGLLTDPDLRELLLPAMRADFRIVGTYEARPVIPLGCPVVGYLGESDPDVTEGDMRAWRDATTVEFDLRTFSGGHFYLADEKESVVRDIAGRLA